MTTKRTYNLGRRAESSAETRQRLVEATAALHFERGISAVSLRDIADRAGVSVGTAYHHFPTYLDAIGACAVHVAMTAPLPPHSIFEGINTIDERVAVMMRELCAWYERHPWLERIRGERALYPPVDESMSQFELTLERLVRFAARCTADEARTIAALSDASVYSALKRGGMTPSRIHGRMAEAALAWLYSKGKRRPS